MAIENIPRKYLSASVAPIEEHKNSFFIQFEDFKETVRAQKKTPFLKFLYSKITLELDQQITSLWISNWDLIEKYSSTSATMRCVLSHFHRLIALVILDQTRNCTLDRIKEDEILKTLQIAHQHMNNPGLCLIKKREVPRTILVGMGKAYMFFIRSRKDFCIGGGISKWIKTAVDLLDGEKYALAICRKEYLMAPNLWDMALNEIELHKKLRGIDGILQIKDALVEGNKIYIITEFMNQGDLKKVFLAKKSLTMKEKLKIALQIGWGLMNMHELKIVHRDLKPENILISLDPGEAQRIVRACIGDLGSACSLDQEDLLKMRTGSCGYLSPERINSFFDETLTEEWVKTSTPEADIWAFGLVLYSLFHPEMGTLFSFQKTGDAIGDAIKDLKQEDLLKMINKPKFEIYIHEILTAALQIDPKNRSSAKQIHESLQMLYEHLPPEAGA